jgi:hypothetical protein
MKIVFLSEGMMAKKGPDPFEKLRQETGSRFQDNHVNRCNERSRA